MNDQTSPEERQVVTDGLAQANPGRAYGGKRRLAERNAGRFVRQVEKARAILRAAGQACSDLMF